MIARKKMNIQPVDAILEDDKENIVSKYISPDPNCICCNTPVVAIKINQAYLNGMNYTQIMNEYNDEVVQRAGRKMDSTILSTHFTKHFNHNGVAIAEYNRKHGMDNLVPVEQGQMKNIFNALVNRGINDLEILDLAMKEQVKRLKELEDMKEERIKQKRTYNLDQLIMKQEMIMNNLQTQLLTKLKIYQKAQIQSKQIEVMDKHLQFLNPKTANFLGLESGVLEPALAKEAERMYLKVVIENLIKRVKEAMDSELTLDPQQQAQYFKELNRKFKGIERDINDEFQEKLSNIQNVGKKV